MAERSQFSTRLGFLLIAAGCAIGLGNVWRFPYITGQYGGAIFVIIYLAFLLGVGVPLLTVELAIGRASRKSIAKAFDILEAPGTKWHLNKFWLIPGSYILMSFYGLITGWMLYYTVKFMTGSFAPGLTKEVAGQHFTDLLANPLTMFVCMTTVIVVSFVILAMGVSRGLEHITKPLMILMFALLIFMAVRSFTLPGFSEGISYYLKPDWSRLQEHGFLEALWAAMGQAFFTLSVGQGSIEIFGSYVNKKHTLLSEGIWIAVLDTVVALLAGFVIFPACFSYGVEPDAGPSLLFVTMNTVFANMAGGSFWGALFFLFMLIAAMSTLIAVFESIIAICMEVFGISRGKSVIINFCIIMLISIPPLLGFNVLDYVHPMGEGSTIMDFQDFLISNNILPLGSLFMVIFVTAKTGMNWKRYTDEVNIGDGPKLSVRLFGYYRFVLAPLIAVLLAIGYYNIFLK
ncbi:MAG: sodium-dependent transporter [Succinivibrio sp.]|jgi:NSS family neurotransmitter:Na+ symporter|nr:sodium-dependent transporter [Succinivibrio sp.]